MRALFIVFTILLCTRALPQEPVDSPPVLETGKVLPSISCSAHPDQTYALYLPSKYTPTGRWPLVLSSDPGARGSAPLELQKDAAEHYGYVLAASNNSRNGPAQPRFEATEAVLNDVQRRVALDPQRIYLAGFSGGARFSSQIAFSCKCSAGVLLSAAGFFAPTLPRMDAPFPVFSAVGTTDFNYSEVVLLQDVLTKASYPRWLRIFEGMHQWAPADVMEEAFAWFRLQAMKSKREVLDADFVQDQFKKAVSRADSLQQAGDVLASWREYAQIAATYDSLIDVSSIHEKAETLAKDKAVREAFEREQSDFQEQARLMSEITTRIAAPQKDEDTPFLDDRGAREQLLRLRNNAEHEKRAERSRVFKRALGGVFVFAMESGNTLLDGKNFAAAVRVYGFATQALPESEWAWERLAVAQAFAGKKKDALASLKRARDLSGDKSAFRKWLQSEAAFAALRSTTEFASLTQ